MIHKIFFFFGVSGSAIRLLLGECDTDGMEREKKKLPVDHRSLAPSVSLIPLRLALTLEHSSLSRNFLLFFHYSAWFEFLWFRRVFFFHQSDSFFAQDWKIISAISINTSQSEFHFYFASSAFCHTFSPSHSDVVIKNGHLFSPQRPFLC